MSTIGRAGPVDPSTRWLIAGPQPDETLRSIVERASVLYRRCDDPLFDRRLPSKIGLRHHAASVDAMGAIELLALGRRLAVPPRSLFAHRLLDTKDLLDERFRRAYCPRCWAKADRDGRPRAFRRAWQSVFALECDMHRGKPLHWSPESNDLSHQDVDIQAELRRPVSPDAAWLMRWLRPHVADFSRVLIDGEVPPNYWRATADEMRFLLLSLALDMRPDILWPLGNGVTIPPTITPWWRTPLKNKVPFPANPWDALRWMGDPACRRTIFWIAASFHARMPEARAHLTPTWFDAFHRPQPTEVVDPSSSPAWMFPSVQAMLTSLSMSCVITESMCLVNRFRHEKGFRDARIAHPWRRVFAAFMSPHGVAAHGHVVVPLFYPNLAPPSATTTHGEGG